MKLLNTTDTYSRTSKCDHFSKTLNFFQSKRYSLRARTSRKRPPPVLVSDRDRFYEMTVF